MFKNAYILVIIKENISVVSSIYHCQSASLKWLLPLPQKGNLQDIKKTKTTKSMVEETGVSGENQGPAISHRQTLSHSVVSPEQHW
jgi:hypothetical protein